VTSETDTLTKNEPTTETAGRDSDGGTFVKKMRNGTVFLVLRGMRRRSILWLGNVKKYPL